MLPTMLLDEETRDDTMSGYRMLALAIVHRALQDTQGKTFAPGDVPRRKIQADARTWLRSGKAAELLELAGYEGTTLHRQVSRKVYLGNVAPPAFPFPSPSLKKWPFP